MMLLEMHAVLYKEEQKVCAEQLNSQHVLHADAAACKLAK